MKRRIIAFAGPAGVGKDTVGRIAMEMLGDCKRTYFAKTLKAMLAVAGMPEPANGEDKALTIEGFLFSWRDAAQRLGTEWGRVLDPDIWVKIVRKEIEADPYSSWVITDCRFENEAAMIREIGGTVVRLTGRRYQLEGVSAIHASEAGLADDARDVYLSNPGSLDMLRRNVRMMLDEL